MILATLAFSLVSLAAPQQEPPAPPFPKPAADTGLPGEVFNWPGFRYAGERRTEVKPFRAAGDWTGLGRAPRPDAVTWRTRIALITRLEQFGGPDGLRRGELNEIEEARIVAAALRLPALVAQMTDGRVNLKVDIVEEPEALAESELHDWVANRVNNGVFETDEKLERGPFQSVILVTPADRTVDVGAHSYGLTGITPAFYRAGAEGAMEAELLRAWAESVRDRAHAVGFTATPTSPTPINPERAWSLLTAPRHAAGEDAQLLEKGGALPALEPVKIPFSPSSVEGMYALTVEDDKDKGKVLRIVERGLFRVGGVAFPMPEGGIDVAATPTLRLEAKSGAPYPVGIRVGKRIVTLGKDVPFRYDNTWQTVNIDLRKTNGPVDVIGVAIAPEFTAPERRARGFVDLNLASVSLEAAPVTEAPVAPGPTPAETVAAADHAALVTLLASPQDSVRFLAADRMARGEATAADVPALSLLLNDLVPVVADRAAVALGNVKTPEAVAALQRAVRFALMDRAKGSAALALAPITSDDPKRVNDLLALLANKLWHTRRDGVRALAYWKHPEAGIMRAALIDQTVPEVRLAVIAAADPTRDYEARKLLYTMVNDPIDRVRVAAADRLLAAKDPVLVTEALKAIRDESLGARRLFAARLAVSPVEAWRGAIRLAIADRDPQVRTSGLQAIAKLGKADPAELQPAEGDATPMVQTALAAAKRAASPVAGSGAQ